MSSKNGLDSIIQDITDMKSLPQKRRLGNPVGCGAMFGDTWHSAKKVGGTCSVFLDDFFAATGVSKRDLIGLVNKDWCLHHPEDCEKKKVDVSHCSKRKVALCSITTLSNAA